MIRAPLEGKPGQPLLTGRSPFAWKVGLLSGRLITVLNNLPLNAAAHINLGQ